MPAKERISEERLERALVFTAYLITRHGPVLTPIFERLERELEDERRRSDPMDRARRLLDQMPMPMKAIR